MEPLVPNRGALDKSGPGFGAKIPHLDGVPGDPLAQLDGLLRRKCPNSVRTLWIIWGGRIPLPTSQIATSSPSLEALVSILLARIQSWLS
jgi:hypothetical protein